MVVGIGGSGSNLLVEPLGEQYNLAEMFVILFLGDILAHTPMLN